MAGQPCINYAICVVASHFGDVVAKVCECLIDRGPLSCPEVARFTELPNEKVKNCLIALIQHNCVQAFSVPKIVGAGMADLTTVYKLILNNIIHRMRFLKFSLIVKEHLGSQYAKLFEGFLQHGRLTFELLYQRASGLNEGKPKRDDVLGIFNKLVHAHYVERCPKGVPFLEPKSDDEVSSIRKCIKHKHEILETNEDIQDKINMNEVLWRVNYEKFVYCLKKKTCVVSVRSRFGHDAAIVLEAMIELSVQQNVNVNSATLTLNSIIECVRRKPGGILFTSELVRASLEQLGCQLCSEDSGALYAFGLKDIIETCQHDEVESFVSKKYGKEACRIFRLLIKTGRWTPIHQISDKTFIEKKETENILCKLLKDGYLEVEKVNLNVGVMSEVYLWKVNKRILWEHVLNDMFCSALNISKQISHVAEECQISHADAQKVQRLNRAKCMLETSLSKLDDAIMLFHDF